MVTQSVEIGSRKYNIGKINPLMQFHIVRRMGPILTEFFPIMGQIARTNPEGQSAEQNFEEIAKIASPLIEGLSKLSDKDAEFVLHRLLAVCEMDQRPQFQSWAKVAHPEQGILLQDIELPELLQLAGRAFMFNLKGFFSLVTQQGSVK